MTGYAVAYSQDNVFAGEVEMHAASLERGDAHNSVDSRECSAAGDGKNATGTSRFLLPNTNIGQSGLFYLHASAHSRVFDAARRA